LAGRPAEGRDGVLIGLAETCIEGPPISATVGFSFCISPTARRYQR
jgi:hypothetical protein